MPPLERHEPYEAPAETRTKVPHEVYLERVREELQTRALTALGTHYLPQYETPDNGDYLFMWDAQKGSERLLGAKPVTPIENESDERKRLIERLLFVE